MEQDLHKACGSQRKSCIYAQRTETTMRSIDQSRRTREQRHTQPEPMHRCLKVLGALEVPQRAQVEPTLHSDLQPQRRYLAVKQHNSDAGNPTPAITHSDLGTHESAVHGRPAAKRHNDLAATLRDYVRGISNRNILKNWDYVSCCTAHEHWSTHTAPRGQKFADKIWRRVHTESCSRHQGYCGGQRETLPVCAHTPQFRRVTEF